ncbi:hypothetical protein BJ508DRAFT_313746 [Ascobolus immersus RN42]|uniref:F-box domain-containing protein n=1 Tax=Ascobolus immersus RN42 TaxID=1160509 RepID=A0A3N4HJK2_ASCIM|nr:hypothetical protein BJ508DRAFT_313746 [Ascobolus immersus RN42]
MEKHKRGQPAVDPPSGLSRLPAELLIQIFELLPITTLESLTVVCKRTSPIASFILHRETSVHTFLIRITRSKPDPYLKMEPALFTEFYLKPEETEYKFQIGRCYGHRLEGKPRRIIYRFQHEDDFLKFSLDSSTLFSSPEKQSDYSPYRTAWGNIYWRDKHGKLRVHGLSAEKVVLDFSKVPGIDWNSLVWGAMGRDPERSSWSSIILLHLINPLMAAYWRTGSEEAMFKIVGSNGNYSFHAESQLKGAGFFGLLGAKLVSGTKDGKLSRKSEIEEEVLENDDGDDGEHLSIVYNADQPDQQWGYRLPKTIEKQHGLRRNGTLRERISKCSVKDKHITFCHVPVLLSSCLVYYSDPLFKLSSLHLEGVQILDNQMKRRESKMRLLLDGFSILLIWQAPHLQSLVLRNVKMECSIARKSERRGKSVNRRCWDGRIARKEWVGYTWEVFLQELAMYNWPKLTHIVLEDLLDSEPFTYIPTRPSKEILEHYTTKLLGTKGVA